jgi:rare lipoprotein A
MTEFSRGRALSLALAALVLAGCAGNSPQPPVASTTTGAERSDRGNPPFYEVFGERYYVLDSSAGYSERGVASWYGRDFHGKPTSSGETYDMRELTAAHKTLPIPTWVEVINLENGESVVVRINDRGPFVDNRIIDLSQRAAEEIGMIGAGTARVQVRALDAGIPDGTRLVSTSASAATPAPASASTPAPAASRGFSIISPAEAGTLGPDDRPLRPLYAQVGAFADSDNAVQLVARLRNEGFRDSFVMTTGQGGELLHRVRIGPIDDAGEFDRIRDDLRRIDIDDVRLVQDN